MWALDDALSEEYWCRDTPPSRGQECVVLAAAEYVKHAAEWLADIGSRSSGWVRLMAVAKWEDWGDRFAEVAGLFDAGGPGPVQWAAWFAREEMGEVGRRTGFTTDLQAMDDWADS